MIPSMTLIEVAFELGTAFKESNITAVLCGGSAATFYAPEAYQSRDLDFVLSMWTNEATVLEIIKGFGFSQVGRTFASNQTPFTLDFPKGPLSVGEDPITSWNTVKKGTQELQVIRPEDSVKDRLAAYFYWNDYPGLSQAVAVASTTIIDTKEIENWARREGELEKFGDFIRRLNS